MPKERLHLLLADQSLQILTSSLGLPPLNEAENVAYFLGAISPDALFYDLPLFRLSAVGEAFHRLEGESCLLLLESISREQDKDPDSEAAAWILGMAHHFLADGIWHPVIREMSEPDTFFCKTFKFSKRQCHHWLESELEGYWLARMGPAHSYLPILRQFAGENKGREACIRCFRRILMRLGLSPIPEEKSIGRCFFWQALLLRLFAMAAWTGWRKQLLQISPTRSFGALTVPTAANPSPLLTDRSPWDQLIEHPCDNGFMMRSTLSLAERLHEFSQKLYPKCKIRRPSPANLDQ
jgi:hypothetical protein